MLADDTFSRRVQQASERLAVLLDEALDEPGERTAEMIRRLLHELSTATEELRVAEEELIVQGEDLATAHLAVDAERERYGRLFDFAPDGYLETDHLGKILEANRAASALVGVPVRFLVNKLFVPFVAEHDRRRVRRLLSAAADGSLTDDEVRVEIVPRAGAPLSVGLKLASDLDPVSETIRVRWLLRDLTERVKAEEQRHALQGDIDLMKAAAEVNRLTEGEDPLQAVLEGLMRLACSVVPEATISATILRANGRLDTEVATDEVSRRLSDIQHVGGGPCTEASRNGTISEMTIEEVGERWPALAAAARPDGIEEVIGLPLIIDGRPHGALNVYAKKATSPDLRRSLRLLADQASAAVANAEIYRSASSLAKQLEFALETRVVIEQAKGALMALQKCDADAAFDILRRASQRSNRKLRDVAAEFLARALAQ